MVCRVVLLALTPFYLVDFLSLVAALHKNIALVFRDGNRTSFTRSSFRSVASVLLIPTKRESRVRREHRTHDSLPSCVTSSL